jgi:hypothetical protein
MQIAREAFVARRDGAAQSTSIRRLADLLEACPYAIGNLSGPIEAAGAASASPWPAEFQQSFILRGLTDNTGTYDVNVTQSVNLNCTWEDLYYEKCVFLTTNYDTLSFTAALGYSTSTVTRLVCLFPNVLALAIGVGRILYNDIAAPEPPALRPAWKAAGTVAMILSVIDLVLTYAIPDSLTRDIAVSTVGTVCFTYLAWLLGGDIYVGCDTTTTTTPARAAAIAPPLTAQEVIPAHGTGLVVSDDSGDYVLSEEDV